MSPLLDRIGAFFLAQRPDDVANGDTAPPRFVPPVPPPDRAGNRVPGATSSFSAAPDGAGDPGPGETAPLAAVRDGAGDRRLWHTAPPAAAPAHGDGRRPGEAIGALPPAAPDPAAVFAVVLGAPAAAVPLAAAAAGELRAQAGSAAALVCVWGASVPPAGASTPAVRRLAERHANRGGEAIACGRLAWLALDADPTAAAAQAGRALAVGGAPVVLTVGGPRPAAFEPLLREADLAIAVLPDDAEEALRALALATLPAGTALTLPPLPPGPPRWAAMAGLARLRALKRGDA